MPLTNKGQKIKDSMRERYGKKKGTSVFYASQNKGTIKGVEEAKKDDWIQDAEKDIEKRGTEGVCTGDKFGGPTCPPGSKRYNLAKTFRKMAKKRQDEEVRGTASPAMQALMKRTAELKAKKERAALMKANKERKDEAQSFSKTDTDAMRDAAKPLNPKPKKAKTPSLTAGGNTTGGANAAGDEGVPVGNDANKKAQELKQQNIKTRSMYEAAPLLAAGLRALAGPLVRRAGIAVGKGAAKGGAKRGAAKMARTAAKDPNKMAALGDAAAAGVETLTSKLKGNRKMEDNTQYKNSYVTTLLETRASKKTQAAKDRFEAGQRIFGKTKSFNPGAPEFRPTAASEKEKLARQGMVPPKVGGRTRKGMRDHTGYRRIGSMLAEAMGLVEGRRAHRGHRDVAGRRLTRPTPTKRTPEEAAAAAAKGQAAHDKRVAARQAHMKAANEKNAAERAKRQAGQTLDPRTGKPK